MQSSKSQRRKAIKLQNTDAAAGRKIRPLKQAILTVKAKENGN